MVMIENKNSDGNQSRFMVWCRIIVLFEPYVRFHIII